MNTVAKCFKHLFIHSDEELAFEEERKRLVAALIESGESLGRLDKVAHRLDLEATRMAGLSRGK